MELIERINALEGEVKLVKSEIKKVLVDLREVMDTAENPFTYLEQLRGGSGFDEERIKQMEESIEALKDRGTGEEEEERIKKLEETMEELKELGGGNGMGEERLKTLEDALQELKELGSAEVERLQSLEDAIVKLSEAGTHAESLSEKPLIHDPVISDPELDEFGVRFGVGTGIRNGNGNGAVNTVTLAQLIQWADSALSLIGIEKLKQVIELYGLTGRIPTEMKDTLLKVAEIPDVAPNREEEGRVETKYCITALCELDRIITGEHQELFVLLKELCIDQSYLKNPAGKHSKVKTKSRSSRTRKTEKEQKKVTSKSNKND